MADNPPPPHDTVKNITEHITQREKVMISPQVDWESQDMFGRYDYMKLNFLDRGAFKEWLREMLCKTEKKYSIENATEEINAELSGLAKTIFDGWALA